ncbi:hypothetical protein [Vibrio pectenicida]|uniref:hypothetical protein n=1 Tax=Vibrio pectenicida TaxID=62763 RepID=UPI00148C5EB6
MESKETLLRKAPSVAQAATMLTKPLRRKLGRFYTDGTYDSKASYQLIACKWATAMSRQSKIIYLGR